MKSSTFHCVVIHTGIGMLVFAMLMSARLGIFQETLYKAYGKHPREAMFYSVRPSLQLLKINLKFFHFLACSASTRIFATWLRPME